MKKMLAIIIICNIFFVSCVYALDISFESAIGNFEGSVKCGGKFCATDLKGSGFIISIVDENGNTVAGTKIKNFWPNGKTPGDIRDVYSCSVSDSIKYDTYDDSNVNIGLPTTINSSNLSSEYRTYFTSTIKNYAKKIVGELKGTSDIDFFEASKNYYFKVEPIYLFKEYLTSVNDINGVHRSEVCYLYRGTTEMLLENLWDRCWSNTAIGPSLGRGYFSGGNTCSINGHWNATRNYIVGLYTPCKDGGSGLFKKGSGKCYSGSALSEYKAQNSNVNELNNLYLAGNGLGVGYVKIKDYKKDYKIKVSKYKTANDILGRQLITGKTVKFQLYKGKNCRGEKYGEVVSTTTGVVTFSNISSGTYSLEEVMPQPSGYKKPANTCVKGEIVVSNSDVSIEVENTPTCASDFELLMEKSKNKEVSMQDRIKLYKQYSTVGNDLRGLLDTNNKTSSTACSVSNFKIYTELGCLSTISTKIRVYDPTDTTKYTDKNINSFGVNNISYFNDTISSNGEVIAYCLSYPTFITNVTTPFEAKIGKMLIDRKEPEATNTVISKKCYFVSNPINGITHKHTTFSSYITDTNLIYTASTGEETQILRNGEDTSFDNDFSDCHANSVCTFTLSSNYLFSKVYAMHGSGALMNDECDVFTCKYYNYLGYGFATKYTDKNYDNPSKKPIVFNTSLASDLNIEVKSGTCPYELSKDEIDYEFRVTDMNFMFPGKDYDNSLGRLVGSNWRSKDISDLSPNGAYYSCLNTLKDSNNYKKTIDSKCDLNKDGYLSKIDLDIINFAFSKKLFAASSRSSNNYLVLYFMEARNDSMNKFNQKPKYKILLNGSDLKKIRNYNKKIEYDNYSTLDCTTEPCKSSFITDLKVGVVKYSDEALSSVLETN